MQPPRRAGSGRCGRTGRTSGREGRGRNCGVDRLCKALCCRYNDIPAATDCTLNWALFVLLCQVAAIVVLRPGTLWSGLTLPESQGGAALPGSSVPQGEGAQPTTSAKSSQATVSPDALQSWCRSSGLAGFKLPRVIAAQWQPLPVNASGKLVKHVVRQTLMQALSVRDGLHSRL